MKCERNIWRTARSGPGQPESDAPVVLPQAHFACPVFTEFKCFGTSFAPIWAHENGGKKDEDQTEHKE